MPSRKRVHIDDKNAYKTLYTYIYKELLALEYTPQRKLLVLCVGTDRSTGDALGPLTGTLLQEKELSVVDIMGDLENPVHATNLAENINYIYQKHTEPFVIAVDAGLGKKKSVGCIDVKRGPLKPGTGVNKKLPQIGDLHITGLVNIGGYMEYLVLQSTRLSLVIKMARIISQSIQEVIKDVCEEIDMVK